MDEAHVLLIDLDEMLVGFDSHLTLTVGAHGYEVGHTLKRDTIKLEMEN